MNRKRAIDIVLDYKKNIKKPETFFMERFGFTHSSYIRWCVDEIIDQIQSLIFVDPLECVERFAKRMNKYSTIKHNYSQIFSIAYDTSMDIYDTLLKEI